MRKVVLTLISSGTSEEVRQSRLVGGTTYAGLMALGPSVGKSFCFYRDDKAYMHTSAVKNIEYKSADELILTTQNSTYSLKIGEAVND